MAQKGKINTTNWYFLVFILIMALVGIANIVVIAMRQAEYTTKIVNIIDSVEKIVVDKANNIE